MALLSSSIKQLSTMLSRDGATVVSMAVIVDVYSVLFLFLHAFSDAVSIGLNPDG